MQLSFDGVFFLDNFSLSMEDGVEQSCGVVHVMKAACKYVEVLLAFAGYQQHSLGGLTVVLHRQECIQTDVDH